MTEQQKEELREGFLAEIDDWMKGKIAAAHTAVIVLGFPALYGVDMILNLTFIDSAMLIVDEMILGRIGWLMAEELLKRFRTHRQIEADESHVIDVYDPPTTSE